jgi:putative membrane protein
MAMMWHDGWGAGNWLLMSFMILVFWALVIAGIVWVVRGRNSPQQHGLNPARRILDERFARGEIDQDEYTRRREHLAAH